MIHSSARESQPQQPEHCSSKQAEVPTKEVKIVRGLPLFGASFAILSDGPRFLSRVALDHPGEIVGVRMGPMTVYLVSHPSHVQQVLVDSWREFGKGSMWKAVRKLFGNGLATNEGEHWLGQRRLIQPLFNATHLHQMAGAMVEVIADELDRLAEYGPDSVVDLGKIMKGIAQSVLLKTLFGSQLERDAAEQLGDLILVAFRAINLRIFLYFMPDWLPLPGDRAFRSAIATIDSTVLGMVSERRKRGHDKEHRDLLSLLMRARDEGDRGMDDRQLRDELVTLFVAGADTTANTLSWLWYVLDQHPEVAARLRAEVDGVLEGRVPTYEDLGRLVYTRQVVQETMRLYPTGWMMPRFADSEQVVDGYRIPAGSALLVCALGTHRNPQLWPDPERFDPERFSPEKSAGRLRYAYYPFGGGPRQCIGAAYAMMEAQLVAAMMVQRYQPRLSPGHRVLPASETLLKPRYGMKMTLGRAPDRSPRGAR